jgi:hypothetical protein
MKETNDPRLIKECAWRLIELLLDYIGHQGFWRRCGRIMLRREAIRKCQSR